MELLSISEIAGRLGTSRTFVKSMLYKGYGVRNEKIRGMPHKGFCWEDVIAVIRGEAEKPK